MRFPFRSRKTRPLKDLNEDRSGMAMIYVTAMLPVIVGFSLLAIDVGRLSTLNSSLQHGADALSLAGAAELDLRPDAITRAENAIATLVTTNESLFSTTVVTIDANVVTTCYLAALPASDATPLNPADCLSKDPADISDSSVEARFVQVIVNPQQYDTIFPATFVGSATNTAQTGAEAVAGFQAAVCDFTPMFICNPYEESTNTDIMDSAELMKHFDRVTYPDRIGRLINMKQTGGNSAQYFPGNFGFLVPQGADANPGASTLRDYVGMANPPACFVASGVELRTGAITSIRFGFNTRFDLYEGPMGGNGPSAPKNDPLFRPALNVRKGVANDKANGQNSACNPGDGEGIDDLNFSKLLRDNCFSTGTCTNAGGRMGDGSWNRSQYWSRAHNGASWPPGLDANATRYDVYLHELANASTLVNDDSNGSADLGEIGMPRCWSGDAAALTSVPDRRIFHAAILNCNALDASVEYGPIQGGSGNELPVIAFARFFLTEPVSSQNSESSGKDADRGKDAVQDGDVWAEMVGIDEPGNADSVARDIVQLYR